MTNRFEGLVDDGLRMSTVIGLEELVTCPVCGTAQDAITGIGTEDGEPVLPQEGAICICGSCGAVNRFSKSDGTPFGKLRHADPGWEDEIPAKFMPIVEELRSLYKKKNPDAIFYTPEQCANDVFKRETQA